METNEERRERVTALVQAAWPEPLSHNKLMNVILDIIRGDERFVNERFDDRLEAVDALTWMHLDVDAEG